MVQMAQGEGGTGESITLKGESISGDQKSEIRGQQKIEKRK